MAGVSPSNIALHPTRRHCGGIACVHRLDRRLRDHEPRRRRGFGDAADGDFSDGSTWCEPRRQCDLDDHRACAGRIDSGFGAYPAMNRRTFLMGVTGALAGCMSRSVKRLNVMNWGDYIAPNTIATFEKEFQVRVRYATYENNEELFGKIMSGNSGWDVVFPTHNRIDPLRDLGLIAPLNHARLNTTNLFARFQNPLWDRNLDWSVPYMWTTSGIAYNRAKYPSAPTSWSDLWRPEAKGKMTMLDDVDDVFGAALAKLGFLYNSAQADELRKAQRE